MTSDPSTLYIPSRADLLIRWCKLHQWHIVALANMDRDKAALCAAPYIADAKYNLYLKGLK